MTARRAILVLAAVALAGCLGDPPAPPRFFVPAMSRESGTTSASTTLVRIRPVRTPVHLRERMVWRRSAVEYGFREDDRWADLPSSYVEQALAAVLADDQDRPEAARPVLACELREFDEWTDGTHEARVVVAVELVGHGRVLLRRSFEGRAPIAAGGADAVAKAMGTALETVAGDVGRAVRASLPDPRLRVGSGARK